MKDEWLLFGHGCTNHRPAHTQARKAKFSVRTLSRGRLPLFLAVMLLEVALDNVLQHVFGQHVIHRGISRRLPAAAEFGNGAARKSLELLGKLGPRRGVDALVDANGLGAAASTSDHIFVKVLRQQLLALVLARELKLNDLIHTVGDGTVKRLRLVGCKDEHKLVGWGAGAVEKGAQGVAVVLGHFCAMCTTLAQKRIGLVHKQQDTLVRGFRPVKHTVQLRDSRLSQRSDIAASKDGVVKTTLLSEATGKHCLAGSGGSMQHEMTVVGLVATSVGGGDGDALQVLLHRRLEHNTLQDITS
eukprot:m.29716 g.29716  ORF g.29716 m.29716 type:complete len:301 (-) comp9244_c0_seq1:973-1875(-)